MARQRDYRAEYVRRLERGRELGVSRQVARGRHPEEGGRLPDGSKATIISLSEIRQMRLRVATLETMHRMNAGLRGPNADTWRRAALKRGWAVFEGSSGRGTGAPYTIDDVPAEIIQRMRFKERQYFFGY